nr:hypothetical protein [Tanacetum cinerariifolium]
DVGGLGDDSVVRLWIFMTCLLGLMWNSGLREGDDDDDDAVSVVVVVGVL